MLGRTLRNHYQIIKLLGQGGFGDTYLAKDLDLPGHPHCVVKHLKPKDPNPAVLPIARRLFDTEAQVLYKLGKLHDQIPTLSAHFEENGEFYFVQDLIVGHDLTKEIIPGKKLSESYTITLLHNILEVLAIVHQQNVIHRDLKPANLMRRQDGKLVLIDFGAVKEIGTLVVNAQGQTTLSIAIGTPGYMPSEQAKGKPKLCSDVYAVGMIGIQALTGLLPSQLQEEPDTGEVIWRNQAQVSPTLANILDRMVRDHFSQRYQNAGEVLQALSPLLPNVSGNQNHGNPVASRPNSHLPVLSTVISPNTTRRTLLQLGGFAGAGFVIAVVSQKFWNNRQGQAKVFTENLGNGVALDMIAIPGGSFVMGSPSTEAGRDNNEGPQHNVSVAPFFMGKYQITQSQWEAVMGNNPSYFKGAKLAVERVSWDNAVEFCQKLSRKTGNTYRLPSEAEWEYACRAGTSTPFYFGQTITPDLVNYNGTASYGAAPKGLYREKTTDVGSFPPNAFGLYDMHGNVLEWCADPAHDNYKGAPQDGRVWDEESNDNRYQDYDLLVNIKNDNRSRSLHGGSWYTDPSYCRSAFRYSNAPSVTSSYMGFRVACVAAIAP